MLARLLGKFERIDIRADGRFDEDWRGLCLEHGIKAIQSRPALAADGTPLGTFVLGFREPVELGGWDDALMAWGTSLAGLALERQRLRERDAMLFGDLQHRIKNIFAIIGAVSHFTFRGTPEIEVDPRGVRQTAGRTRQFAHVRSPDRPSHPDREHACTLRRGPRHNAVRATRGDPPETSTTLDLALHELATNAAKYGSLSWPSGRLDVAGDVVQADAAEGQFELSWMESGGPPVAPPTRSGFGRAVIERNLAQSLDATVSLEFNSDGLRCTLTAPFNEKFGKL